MTFNVERRDDIHIIDVNGKPELSELKAIIERLEEQRAGLRLWNLKSGVDVTVAEVRQLSGRKAAFIPQKTAIVTDQDLAFGLANVYKGNAGLTDRFQVFREVDVALDWLRDTHPA